MEQTRKQHADHGRCLRCGGRIAATHMLTKTYALSEDGKWQRRLDDFVEDVVVVCANCGDAPEGRFESAGVWFAFVPADVHRNDGQASVE